MKHQSIQGKHQIWLAAIVALIIGMSLAASACQAASPKYPTKAVDVVVTYAPGGSSDLTARIAAEFLTKKWGQPINVVNKPGGSGVVGVTAVMASPADGYTVMVHSFGNTSTPALLPDTPYKWDDLTPLALLVTSPQIIAVPVDSPWKTLKDLVEGVKGNPGKYKYASSGAASTSLIGLTKLFRSVGINESTVTPVSFDGAAPAVTALAGGNVAFAGEGVAQTLPLMQAGKLRALAVTSKVRSPKVPDVPTGAEAGYPAYDVSTWNGFSGPPKLPESVVTAWSEALKEAAQNAEVAKKFEPDSGIMDYRAPADFKRLQEDVYTTVKSMAR